MGDKQNTPTGLPNVFIKETAAPVEKEAIAPSSNAPDHNRS